MAISNHTKTTKSSFLKNKGKLLLKISHIFLTKNLSLKNNVNLLLKIQYVFLTKKSMYLRGLSNQGRNLSTPISLFLLTFMVNPSNLCFLPYDEHCQLFFYINSEKKKNFHFLYIWHLIKYVHFW